MIKEHICIHIVLEDDNKYRLTMQNSIACEGNINEQKTMILRDKPAVIENIVPYIQNHLINIKRKERV